MTLIPKIVEGKNARYITGSGQTRATADRVNLYRAEGDCQKIQRPPRKRKEQDKSNPPHLTSANKVGSFGDIQRMSSYEPHPMFSSNSVDSSRINSTGNLSSFPQFQSLYYPSGLQTSFLQQHTGTGLSHNSLVGSSGSFGKLSSVPTSMNSDISETSSADDNRGGSIAGNEVSTPSLYNSFMLPMQSQQQLLQKGMIGGGYTMINGIPFMALPYSANDGDGKATSGYPMPMFQQINSDQLGPNTKKQKLSPVDLAGSGFPMMLPFMTLYNGGQFSHGIHSASVLPTSLHENDASKLYNSNSASSSGLDILLTAAERLEETVRRE